MLRNERIGVWEGNKTYVNKTSASKECGLCLYWLFKDVGFKLKKHVCNKCHDLLTMDYSLKSTSIHLLMGISKNEGLKRLYNSVIYDRGVL